MNRLFHYTLIVITGLIFLSLVIAVIVYAIKTIGFFLMNLIVVVGLLILAGILFVVIYDINKDHENNR